MRYRKIGNTDLEASVVCLGSWVFGGDCWGEANDTKSIQVARKALEKGINIIDTAPIYGSGHSEEIIGRVLKNNSSEVLIATKMGLEKKGKAIRPNLSAAFIREELENSLRRLGVEKIDLYQCHWPDPNTPMEETFEALQKLVSEEKIRYIGASNFNRVQLEKANTNCSIASNQMQYSLLERDIEKEILPFCLENKISILSYGPLGGGILTGKYNSPPSVPKGDVKSFFYRYYKEPFWSKAVAVVSTLKEIAETRKVPVSEVAINWVLSNTVVASCIVGCRTTEQLDQNINAGEWELTTEELTKIQNTLKKAFNQE